MTDRHGILNKFENLSNLLKSTNSRIAYRKEIISFLECANKEEILQLSDSQLSLLEPYWEKYFDFDDQVYDRMKTYWGEIKRAFNQVEKGSLRKIYRPQTKEHLTIELDINHCPIITTGELKEGQICLTFDDGPHPTRTNRLLDILQSFKVKANFFMIGENAKRNPEVLKRADREGHILGSHTNSHPDLTTLSTVDAMEEIQIGHRRVVNIAGTDSRFFRFPYGASNEDLRKKISERGMGIFFWSIDSQDWRIRDPEKLYQYVTTEINVRKRGVVLFHDIHEQSLIVSEKIINDLIQKGYEIVTFIRRTMG